MGCGMKKLLAGLLLATAQLPAALLSLNALDYTKGGDLPFMEDGNAIVGFSGVITGTFNGGSVIQLLCVDLFANISAPSTNDSVSYQPRAWRHEDRAAWLYVNVMPTLTTAIQGQALQLAIWDIVHDNGDGLSAGRIRQSGSTPQAVIDQFQIYLTSSAGQSSMAASIYFNTTPVTGEPLQTLLGFFQPGSPPAPAPEPGTFGLIAAAAGITMLVGRRRKGPATSAARAHR